MHPLLSAALVVMVLVSTQVPVAQAGNCSTPDTPSDCSEDCASWKLCLRCCVRTRASASICKAECSVLALGTSSGDAGSGLSTQAVSRRPAHPARPARPVRPGRTAVSSGQPTPTPSIDAAGFTASCQADQARDRLLITLEVHNGTGADVRGVTPSAPLVQREAGARLSLGKVPMPRSYALIGAGSSATFQWQGRLSGGAVGLSVSVAAVAANGAALSTAQVDCGTLGGGVTPVPTPTPTAKPGTPSSPTTPAPAQVPAGATIEASQCANCHEAPHMAFVVSKWLQSKHAASLGAAQDNTYCARCHAPLQADPAATESSSVSIPASQWQSVTCSSCHPSDELQSEWNTPIAAYDAITGTYTPVPLWDADQLCLNCHTGPFATEFEGYGLVMHYAGVRCIDCHMAKIPGDSPSIGQRAAHDFKVAENLPYSCGTVPGGCHARRPESWAVRILELGPMHVAH